MNNLNFGNAKYQYYETICSGSPAGPGFPGTDAVHTHMTNTRLTDPEILEFRYPVRAGGLPHPQGLGRQAANGTRATASAAPSASSRRWTARCSPATARAAVRPGGRRERPGRRELRAPQGRHDREAQGLRRDRDRRRRGDHHPDADRGRDMAGQIREGPHNDPRRPCRRHRLGRARAASRDCRRHRTCKLVAARVAQGGGHGMPAKPRTRALPASSRSRTLAEALSIAIRCSASTTPSLTSWVRTPLEAIAAGRHVVVGTSGLRRRRLRARSTRPRARRTSACSAAGNFSITATLLKKIRARSRALRRRTLRSSTRRALPRLLVEVVPAPLRAAPRLVAVRAAELVCSAQ